MVPRGLLVCLLALASMPRTAHAQVPDSATVDTTAADTPAAVYRLPAVQATVARGLLPVADLPMATADVDRQTIQRGRATVGLDEALAGVPGVDVSNRHNLALGTRISVRGFGARAAFGVRGIRILQDGIPLTGPDGQATLTNVDLASAGRIQVLRGPSSLLYGNAAGGVISIETEEPDAAREAQARLVVGNEGSSHPADFWKLQGSVGGRGPAASFLAALDHMSLRGFRAHSAARRDAFNGKLRFAPGDGSQLMFVLNAADVPLAESPGALPADSAQLHPRAAWPHNVATGSGETSRQVQAGLRYRRRLGAGTLDVSVYGLGRSVGTALPYGIFIELGRTAGGMRTTYRADARLAGHPVTLAAGLDADAQRDARQERDNVAGSPGDQRLRDELDRVASIGAFALARVRAARFADVTGGVRYDATSFGLSDHLATPTSDHSGHRTLGAFSASGGGVGHLTDAVDLYASVSTSFQTPTTTELINAPPVPGDSTPAGFNPDLRPQKALSVEAGARGHLAPALAVRLAVYTMDVRDALVPYQVPSVPGRDFYRNAARSRRRGVELALDAQLLHGVAVSLAYTRNDFVFLDDGLPNASYEGHRVPGVPHDRVTATATWSTDGDFVQAELRGFDRMFVDDANTATNPPAGTGAFLATLDLRTGMQIPFHGRIIAPFLSVQNAAGVRYNSSVVVNAVGGRFYEPAPGRSFLFGVTVTARSGR